MSNLQLSIIGGLALWVLLIMIVLEFMSINRSQRDQDESSITLILYESQPVPLEPAYLRGVQAGTRIRAGSIDPRVGGQS